MKIISIVAWAVFALSVAAFFFLAIPLRGSYPPPPTTDWTFIVPVITALVSLITALTTSYVSIRQRMSEDRKTELEIEKMKLELRKLQKDLDQQSQKKE